MSADRIASNRWRMRKGINPVQTRHTHTTHVSIFIIEHIYNIHNGFRVSSSHSKCLPEMIIRSRLIIYSENMRRM